MEEAENTQKPCQKGAPKWVVTFGDLMSLLLCFFVLLLSFSEMDRAKYKEVAGSLSKAFGVQRKDKAFQIPKGISMIAKDFDQSLIPPFRKEEFVNMSERHNMGQEIEDEVSKHFKSVKDLIEVEVKGKEVRIRMMGESAFNSGEAVIRQQMRPLLKKIGELLKKAKGDIVVSGHTDNVPIRKGGQFGSNLKLSASRAASVAEYLIDRTAVKPQRISTMGFGEYRPRETNETAVGRAKNRRVEIILKGFSSDHILSPLT